MVLPVFSTKVVPVCTRLTDSVINPSISFAAWALRCARLRTSLATTEKPRPCSPARAASTAALSAKILVWKAIPLIRVVISAIRCELLEMSRMVLTTLSTSLPPCWAVCEASVAS